MRAIALVLLTFGFAVVLSVEAARKDPKECEVCRKVLTDVRDGLDEGDSKDLVAIEGAIDSECSKLRKAKPDGPERKLCYFIEPVKRSISQPMKNGVPVERICKRLKKSAPEVCEIRFPEKLDLSKTDITKLRVRQLKKILNERGLKCDGCLEKGDYVRKVREAIKDEL